MKYRRLSSHSVRIHSNKTLLYLKSHILVRTVVLVQLVTNVRVCGFPCIVSATAAYHSKAQHLCKLCRHNSVCFLRVNGLGIYLIRGQILKMMLGVPCCCSLAPMGTAVCLKRAEVKPCLIFRINFQNVFGVVSMGPGAEQKLGGMSLVTVFLYQGKIKVSFYTPKCLSWLQPCRVSSVQQAFCAAARNRGLKLLWFVTAVLSSNSTFKSNDF